MKTDEDDDMSKNSGETKLVNVNVGHEVTEYGNFWLKVPADATAKEIKQLAVESCLENTDGDIDMFVDADLGDSSGLRILSVQDKDEHGKLVNIEERILLEPNYYEIGEQTENAVANLQRGILTKDQLLFEVLSVVFENYPENGPRVSKEFLEPFKEAALRNTRQKIDDLVNNHQGIISADTGPVALTMESPYVDCGEMTNVIASPPSVVSANGKIFYAYEEKGGKTALVSRDHDTITAIYENGDVSVYQNDPGLFMENTGLVRSRDRAMEIVRDLHYLVRQVVDEENLSLPNEAAKIAEDGTSSWSPTEE